MKKYIYTFTLVLFAGLIACISDTTSKDETIDENNSASANIETEKTRKIPKTDDVPKEFLKTCQAFYDGVCMRYPSPRPILNESGFYVLDINKYKNNLRSLDLFTETFIEKQDEQFSDCQMALLADSITPELASDGIDVNAPAECSYFHYNYYLQSQEAPDGFFLRKTAIHNNSAFTEIHFYTTNDKSFFDWDHLIVLNLKLVKVKNSWKISDVQKIMRED